MMNSPLQTTDVHMHLTILPPKLKIAAISVEKQDLMIHPLITQLLYCERDEDGIFGITKTQHELSLVMEKKAIAQIDTFAAHHGLSDAVQIWPQNWIALRTDLGSSGADTNGSVINSLARPLAQAKITIFYLSTYSSDYCLVEEHNVARALRVLRDEFTLIVEGEELVSDFHSSPSPQVDQKDSPHSESSVERRKLFLHANNLHLAHITQENVPQLSLFLLKCFFFQEESNADRIVSYIEAECEASLIVDRKLLKNISPLLLQSMSVYNESWKAFSIGDQPLGYSESGIVYSVSSPLASCNSNVFYMSTFRTDYCLVGTSGVDDSVQTLKSHFTVEYI